MNFQKHVCSVIRFRGNQKYQRHVHGDDIEDALSPSTAIFDLFLMKQYIRINTDV